MTEERTCRDVVMSYTSASSVDRMLHKWCVSMSCRRPVSYGFPVREVMSNVSSEVVHVFDLVWLCVWKRERLHTYKDLAGTLGMAHVQRVKLYQICQL